MIPLMRSVLIEKLSEKVMFYSCLLSVIPMTNLALWAKYNKDPVNEMVAVILALVIPVVIIIGSTFGKYQSINNKSEEFIR